jgi:hypothetical protein
MTDYPWYGLADGVDLQQGDLLFGSALYAAHAT